MMPLPTGRKTCRMEKVENLYRTARAQNDSINSADDSDHAWPWCRYRLELRSPGHAVFGIILMDAAKRVTSAPSQMQPLCDRAGAATHLRRSGGIGAAIHCYRV